VSTWRWSAAGRVPGERALIEGRIVPLSAARVPATDRGLLLGDSIFETIRTVTGSPLLLGEHLDRLQAASTATGIPLPGGTAAIEAGIAALLRGQAPGREWIVRVTVTRGVGGPGLRPNEPAPGCLVVLLREAANLDAHASPARVTVAHGLPVPLGFKHGSQLAAVLALRAAIPAGYDDVLLCAPDGSLSEGSTSNLFVVHGATIRTPDPAASRCLPGITRASVIRVLQGERTEVVEGPCSVADVASADEVFLTSTVRGIVPVAEIDGQRMRLEAPGPLTARVDRLLRAARTAWAGGSVRRLAEASRGSC
jgi:branched-chain amino acid aminotransferase